MRNPIAPPQQLCEAYFYAGQYQLLKGRTDQAHRFLQESKRIAVYANPFVHKRQRKAAVSYGGALQIKY
jgi:lipoprotein NlpI